MGIEDKDSDTFSLDGFPVVLCTGCFKIHVTLNKKVTRQKDREG